MLEQPHARPGELDGHAPAQRMQEHEGRRGGGSPPAPRCARLQGSVRSEVGASPSPASDASVTGPLATGN